MTKSEFENVYYRFIFLGLDNIKLPGVELMRCNGNIFCDLEYSDDIFDLDFSIIYKDIYAPNLKTIYINGNMDLKIVNLTSNQLTNIHISGNKIALNSFNLKEDNKLESVILHANESLYLSSFLNNQFIDNIDISSKCLHFDGNVFKNCSINNCTLFLSNLVNYSNIKQYIHTTFYKCNIHNMNTIPFILVQEDFYSNSLIQVLNIYIKESIHAVYVAELNNLSKVKIQNCNIILDALYDRAIIGTMKRFYNKLLKKSNIEKVDICMGVTDE